MTKDFENGPSLADFLPDVSQGFQAVSGTALAPSQAKRAEQAAIISALESVQDPEIPVNIYELGLIYDIIRDENGDVTITMSLTAPGCPVAGEMPKQVADVVSAVAGVGQVTVTLVWDPAWTPDRMSEDAKMALDFMG